MATVNTTKYAQDVQTVRTLVDGVLLDMMPYAENDPEWDFDDYFPLGFRECIIDGHLFAVPLQWGASIIFYNADLFEKAGIKYEDETWTWDAFVEAAKAMSPSRK